MDANFRAFTWPPGVKVSALVTDAGISAPTKQPKVPTKTQKALWDTGSTGSAISEDLAKTLGLIPVTKRNVIGVNTVEVRDVYQVDIYLPDNVRIANASVTSYPPNRLPFNVLIGMDIITRGDFAVTHADELTAFSFRIPSKETIDYVAQHKRLKAPAKKLPVVGRNAMCPCGSGKKFKHCHGAPN